MAARLFQDQNLIDHVNGGGTISGKAEFTGQGKGRVGGRKPLGDLSNAGKPINQVDGKKALIGSLNTGKPSVSQMSKSLKSKNTTVINNEAFSAKAKNIGSNKRTAGKATEKSHTGGRKALSDISNSRKPCVPEIKIKNTLKSSLPLNAIAEDIFHNHKKCIKSQFETVDMHHFLKTVGLEDDSNDRMEISLEVPAFGKLKYESEYLELEEVPEHLPEVPSLSEHGSPAHCKSPEHLPEVPSLSEHGSPAHCKSPKCTMWNDFAVNFKLIETPKLSKN